MGRAHDDLDRALDDASALLERRFAEIDRKLDKMPSSATMLAICFATVALIVIGTLAGLTWMG